MMDKIYGFKEEPYKFLSNFTYLETPLHYQSLQYPTVEHFYVAMKTKDLCLREKVSNHPLKGLKNFGRTLELREDWDDIKLDVMRVALTHKFSEHNPTLRQKLRDTGDLEIVEANWWGDYFWGVDMDTGYGENNLGKLLMKIRGEIE